MNIALCRFLHNHTCSNIAKEGRLKSGLTMPYTYQKTSRLLYISQS